MRRFTSPPADSYERPPGMDDETWREFQEMFAADELDEGVEEMPLSEVEPDRAANGADRARQDDGPGTPGP